MVRFVQLESFHSSGCHALTDSSLEPLRLAYGLRVCCLRYGLSYPRLHLTAGHTLTLTLTSTLTPSFRVPYSSPPSYCHLLTDASLALLVGLTRLEHLDISYLPKVTDAVR